MNHSLSIRSIQRVLIQYVPIPCSAGWFLSMCLLRRRHLEEVFLGCPHSAKCPSRVHSEQSAITSFLAFVIWYRNNLFVYTFPNCRDESYPPPSLSPFFPPPPSFPPLPLPFLFLLLCAQRVEKCLAINECSKLFVDRNSTGFYEKHRRITQLAIKSEDCAF